MLESLYITKSKIRRDILSLFFANPAQKRYLRELERLLGHSAGNIRRELLKFKDDDLFLTEKVGNLLYYHLNKKHPLYREIKEMVRKTSGMTARIREALANLSGIDVAFLYGSWAAGTSGSASDIDVMIIGDEDTIKIAKCVRELEEKFSRQINFIVYSKEEFDTKKGGSEFIKNVLQSPKEFLVGSENGL